MKRIAPDKKRHFLVGIPLGTFLQVFFSYFLPFRPEAELLVSVLALIIICYGFELFSLLTRIGQYDFGDAIAGIIGGSIGILVCWIFVSVYPLV